MRFLKYVIAISTALSFIGCMHSLRMPPDALLNAKRIFENLEAQKASRPRMSGRYKLKATGIKQFFGSVDVIFAVQQPSSFYVSVPSFFGNPARIVASDGGTIFLLDLSTEDTNYSARPSTSSVLQEWLGLKIEPKDFVNALLSVVDLKDAALRDIKLTNRNKHYETKLMYPGQKQVVLEFDSDTDNLLLTSAMDLEGRLLYQVKYADFRDMNGQRFPNQITIRMKSDTESIELVLFGEEFVFHDVPFEPSTFQIEEP